MKEIAVGIIGLGRLGKKHAENLAFRVRGARLKAACALSLDELNYAKTQLQVEQTFNEVDAFFERAEVEAVFVVSSSSLHAEHSIKALAAGKHVFCEKPISFSLEEAHRVREVKARHPKQKFTVGFQRRYDPSYTAAKEKIAAGAIGTPFLVRSQTVDLNETAPFQVEFSKTSGGFFIDAGIHDLDLARWFLASEVEAVYTLGGCYVHKGFEKYQDVDNGLAVCRFKNGAMATLFVSRTAQHGHATSSEIIGTKGALTVGLVPSKDRVQIADQHGVRTECLRTFYDRFETAFLLEAQAFVDSLTRGTPLLVGIEDAIKAQEIAIAVTKAYRERREVLL